MVLPISSDRLAVHYSDGHTNHGPMSLREIESRVHQDVNSIHLVWLEGWPQWKTVTEAFPYMLDLSAPNSNSTLVQSVSTPSSMKSDARLDAPKPPNADNASAASHKEHERSEARSASLSRPNRRYIMAGLGALTAVAIFIAIFLMNGSENDYSGNFEFRGSDALAFISIVRVDDSRYRVTGEAATGLRDEDGPYKGSLDMEVVLKDGVLHGTDDFDYQISIRGIENGIEVIERGSNKNFDYLVDFSHVYTRTGNAALRDEIAEISVSSDVELYEQDGSEQYVIEVEPSLEIDGETLGLMGRWTASSVLDENEESYGARHLNDMNARTVWAENSIGLGVGESLEFTPEESGVIECWGLAILNGHCKTTALWEANARAQRIRIQSGGSIWEVDLLDTPNWQYIRLPGFEASGSVRVEILSVIPGSKYEDLTLAELDIIQEVQSAW